MVTQILCTAKRLLLLLIIIMTINSPAQAAVQAKIDRSRIGINESFTLIFETDSSVSSSPDFSPLQKDFEIINNSRSSNTQIINGNISQSTTWTVILFPKTSGALTIPAIDFDGELSNPIDITVIETQNNNTSPQDEPVFLEVSAEPQKTYVQAQTLYTVRLYYAASLNLANNASLSDPQLDQADALVKKLGEDKSYETWRNNQRYIVYERQYAIFPQKSGELTINPIQFNGQIIQRSRGGLFDMDPFFSSRGQMLRRLSEKAHLDVAPIPDNYRSRNWLPAKHLSLTETWAHEPPIFKVGEPITRSISISAEGLTSSQIPELSPSEPKGFKLYPDQPYLEDRTTDTGITAIRQEKIAMIPTQAGSFTLPEIEVHWWNTQTQRPETARIAARTVNVQAAEPTTLSTPAPDVIPETSDTLSSSLNSPQPSLNTPGASSNITHHGLWPWLSAFFATGWITTIGWMLFRRRPKESSHTHPDSEKLNTVINTLRQACKQNSPHAAKNALLQWAKIIWPKQTPTSLGSIAEQCDGALANALYDLSARLYRPTSQTTVWNGLEFWHIFSAQKNINQPESSRSSITTLEPLHKIEH